MGCGICAAVCTEGAIIMRGPAVVNQAVCTGCGACVEMCALEAIALA